MKKAEDNPQTQEKADLFMKDTQLKPIMKTEQERVDNPLNSALLIKNN